MEKRRILKTSAEWVCKHVCVINTMPAEILYNILDISILQGCDWKSLELVCKHWRDICYSVRARRYSTLVASMEHHSLEEIVIHLNENPHLKRLCLLMQENPQLDCCGVAQYIESLRVEGDQFPTKHVIRFFPNLLALDLIHEKKPLSLSHLGKLATLESLCELRINLLLPSSLEPWFAEETTTVFRRLRKLSLSSFPDNYLLPKIPSGIGMYLNNLESLELIDILSSMDVITANLQPPNLRELIISESGLHSGTSRVAFANLLNNCGKNLKRLKVHSLAPMSAALQAQRLLEGCILDTLEDLQLEGFYFTPQIIRTIAEKCPKVNRVALENGFLNIICVPKMISQWFSWMPLLQQLVMTGICANCKVEYEYSRTPSDGVVQTKDLRKHNLFQPIQLILDHH